ncbi:MAG: hypothetical protein LBC73_01565 [Oscillospiraceae bacterium]|jgi:hypothetical protein|nr:hypothetical protein [Oscillospiraceae bacterium]
MVTIIPENERKVMTREDIERTYNGKWVFLTWAVLTPGLLPLEGIPTVLADMPYEGTENGIYKKFKNKKKYGQLTTLNYSDSERKPCIVSPLREVMA